MAKRSRIWTNNRLQRYLDEGRGNGEGKEYKPWLTVQDFPSIGRSSRILGVTTNRVHHFFTDLQTKCFYIWEWDKKVLDIREHYPLLDLEEIIDLEDINLDLFKDKTTGENYIITTTFLLTVKDRKGNINYYARSVKSKSELNKRTTMEKLEIERRYWTVKNIHWALITEEDIPEMKAKNIQWIHGVMNEYRDYGIDASNMVRLCAEFLDCASKLKLSIRRLLYDFEVANDLVKGTSLFIFKYLISTGLIDIDLNKEIDFNMQLNQLLVLEEDRIC